MMKPLKRDKSIRSFLEKRLSHYGLKEYCYFLFSKYSGKATTIISNYPQEWIDEYVAAEYYLTDPVILHAKQTIVPFSWRELDLKKRSYPLEGVAEFRHRNRIFDGFTFPVHDASNRIALLSFCNYDGNQIFHENIRLYQAELQLLLINTHDKVIRYINDELVEERDEFLLSSRELEILKWVSMGKTYIESAIILGIRERTIKFHMKNIVNKLNVSNAKHAIKKAIELNLLN